MYKRFVATTQTDSVIFKYDGMSIEKILDLAIGDTSKLNMRIENSITEEALEQL